MTFCRNCGSSLPCTCASSYGPGREEIEYEREKREREHRAYVPAPHPYDVFKKNAWKSYEEGEYADALEWIHKSIIGGCYLGESWNIKGIILESIAQKYDSSAYEDSIYAYNRAIEYEPQNETFKNNKALCLYEWAKYLDENGKYDLAMDKINEALTLFENKSWDYANALDLKGNISRHTGQLIKALIYYDCALNDYPGFGNTREKRNNVLQLLSNSKIELEDFKSDYPSNMSKRSDESKSLYLSAEKLYQNSEYLNVALDILEISFRLCNMDYDTYFRLRQNIKERIAVNEDLLRLDKKKLITITGTEYYNCPELEKGMIFKLKKEPENIHDKNAIAVYLDGNQIGYVANGIYTTDVQTSKASDIQYIDDNTEAEYLFNHDGEYHIARIIE